MGCAAVACLGRFEPSIPCGEAMTAAKAFAAVLFALWLSLSGVKSAAAQDVPALLHREVSERWAAVKDPVTGIVSLISPAYPLGSGCVINELTAPVAGVESGNLAASQLLKRLFVGLEGRGCSEIPGDWYASVYEPDPLYDVMRFATRVVKPEGVEVGLSSPEERHLVSECVARIPLGLARMMTIRSAVDFDDSGHYLAEISCDLISRDQRVVARGVPWSGGEIQWAIIRLPTRPH